MKGTIKADHATTDKYVFAILGLPPLNPIKVSGLEEEVKSVDLPDGTTATTGNTGSSECTIVIPGHHTIEIAAMELWVAEGKDPVSATYKKSGVVTVKKLGGTPAVAVTKSLFGVWAKKRTDPDLEMKPDAEMANVTYVLSIDGIMPI